MWGTNFPQWLEGDYHWEFCLFGAESVDETLTAAMQIRQGSAPELPFALPKGVRMLKCFPTEQGDVQLVLQNLQTKPCTCPVGAAGWETTPVALNDEPLAAGWRNAENVTFESFTLRGFLMKRV